MEPFIGEIRILACNYAPRGWAFCEGQILQIAQNQALFSIIGTTYGGDGKTTFALPNLAGRAPLHRGLGSGLALDHVMGEAMGTTTVTLTASQLPTHSHGFNAVSGMAKQTAVAGAMVSEMNTTVAGRPSGKTAYSDGAASAQLSVNAASAVGSASPAAHQNCQPYQILNVCIAVQGIYPTRP